MPLTTSPYARSPRCNCESVSFSNPLVAHLALSSALAAANLPSAAATPALVSSSASTASSSPSTAYSSPSLSTPALPGACSYFSADAPAKPSSRVDLAHLNSLLYQLAQPPTAPAPYLPSATAIVDGARSPTPRLRGNGAFREPRSKRAERKAQFEALLDTFHRATLCTFEPESYHLSASDLAAATPVTPDDVLRGVASSMSEPVQRTGGQEPIPSPENPGKLIQASGIAAPYQESIKAAIEARLAEGKPRPKLVGILPTPSPPSVAYAEWTRKACEAVGIEFEIWKTWDDRVPASADAAAAEAEQAQGTGSAPDFDLVADVEDLIIAANADDSVHGIMVYYPIFHGRQDTYLQQIVDPRKDVEGLHFSYCWNMYHNVRWVQPARLGGAPGTTQEVPASETRDGGDEEVPKGMAKSILPCTPLAMVKCLEAIGVYDRALPYGDRLFGKTITVVNRSEVVGRPLAALLSNDGARVYSVDIDSIQEFNKRAPCADNEGRARSDAVKAAHARNAASRLRPHHVVRACALTAEECIRASDVVIAGVPLASYKIPTEWIQPGATCINFSSEKNFDKDVRTRAARYLPAIGKTTIAMLQRNLLRLVEYRELVAAGGAK